MFSPKLLNLTASIKSRLKVPFFAGCDMHGKLHPICNVLAFNKAPVLGVNSHNFPVCWYKHDVGIAESMIEFCIVFMCV